jgi:predicted RNase H-like HicB family nuclease
MAEVVYGLIHEAKGRFGISFPDFPGVASAGASVEEAMGRGAETLRFHVEGMIADKEPLPVQRDLDALRKDKTFRADAKDGVVVAVLVDLPSKSTRVNVMLDEALLGAIDRAARQRGQTRSAFLSEAARERIKARA